MELLQRLFPGISEIDADSLPDWGGFETPWEIFGSSNSDLSSQIEGLANEDGGMIIHPSAKIGEYVFIEGPCFIGPEVEIRHSAYIRKGSWICEGALVGHCSEIKNSILLPGSKAPHFNYVGDSVLGIGVNLGAGVKLSNLRNDGTEVFLKIDGTRVPSGLRKFGAILGENSQLGCNSVTNPGTVLGNGSVVWPNTTVTGVHPAQSIHR